MSVLIIVRHGQSQYNLENRFTGWLDVDLSSKGIEEARMAGKLLSGYKFDMAFTSNLKRAVLSLDIILNEIGQTNIPILKTNALNERMYGDLQGLNKDELIKQYGSEKVKLWRKSFDASPPNGESLKDTAARVVPYWTNNILPGLVAGKTILICAHGNSIRALVMHIENLSKEQILDVEIPTGTPKYYEFNNNMDIIKSYYF